MTPAAFEVGQRGTHPKRKDPSMKIRRANNLMLRWTLADKRVSRSRPQTLDKTWRDAI